MEFKERLDAAVAGMDAAGLDLLIGFSGGAHSISRPDAVVLLGGVKALGESMILLWRDGASMLAVTPRWDAERAARRSRAAETVGVDDIAEALAETLRRRPVAAARIGVAGLATLPHDMEDRIAGLLEGEARAVDDVLERVGARKTDEEIARARKATEIAEEGYRRLLEIARPGMPECELAAELNWYMKSLGAESNFLMLSASPHNRAVQPSSGRPLEVGDVVLGELTPSYQGQFAQICRSAVVGPPSDVLREKYDLVVRAMVRGIEAARPGARMADVCGAINRVLEQEGYGEYCFPPHIRRRGHGLGYGSTVPGDVAVDNDITLEEDMFFVIHPNQYLPETGYLLCGEPVAITRDGPAVLSRDMAALGTIAA